MIEVKLKLPADLVRDAAELDLLEATVLADLLRTELDRRVMELVNTEIHIYRQEKRTPPTPSETL